MYFTFCNYIYHKKSNIALEKSSQSSFKYRNKEMSKPKSYHNEKLPKRDSILRFAKNQQDFVLLILCVRILGGILATWSKPTNKTNMDSLLMVEK